MNALHTLSITPVLNITGNCSRCGRELTDSASINAGIGPVCRGLANKILAMEMPTAWDAERVQALLFVPAEVFPAATQERWAAVYAKIFTSKGMGQLEAFKGEDWRKTVQELVFFMSVAPTNAVVEALLGAIRGLGYERYAAYICGESSSGESSMGVVWGVIWFKGPYNKIGVYKLRLEARAQWNDKEKCWEVSKAFYQTFVRIVAIYWPFTKGMSEAIAQAKAPYLLRQRADMFCLWAPYKAEFVAEMKAAIPRGERVYEPDEHLWIIDETSKDTLLSLLSKHF